MIDIAVLRGATVRDNAGTMGELMGLSLPWVKVGWRDEGKLLPREESFLRSDPRMESIHILTLDAGWVPLMNLVGKEQKEETGPRGPSLVEDLEYLLEFDLDAALDELAEALECLGVPCLEELDALEPEELLEELDPDGQLLLEKPRSPFKTAASIGPSVAGGWPATAGGKHHMRHRKTDYWDCTAQGKYKYKCRGKEGEVKIITRDATKKSHYNADYKEYRKNQMNIAASGKRIRAKNAKKRAAAGKGGGAGAKKPGAKTQAKKPGLISRLVSKVKGAVKKLRGK